MRRHNQSLNTFIEIKSNAMHHAYLWVIFIIPGYLTTIFKFILITKISILFYLFLLIMKLLGTLFTAVINASNSESLKFGCLLFFMSAIFKFVVTPQAV